MTETQMYGGLSVGATSPTANTTITFLSFDPQASTPGSLSSVPYVSFSVFGDYAFAGGGTATTATLTVLGEAIDISQASAGNAYNFHVVGNAYLHTDGYWWGSAIVTTTDSGGASTTKVVLINSSVSPPLELKLYSTSSSWPAISGANVTRLT